MREENDLHWALHQCIPFPATAQLPVNRTFQRRHFLVLSFNFLSLYKLHHSALSYLKSSYQNSEICLFDAIQHHLEYPNFFYFQVKLAGHILIASRSFSKPTPIKSFNKKHSSFSYNVDDKIPFSIDSDYRLRYIHSGKSAVGYPRPRCTSERVVKRGCIRTAYSYRRCRNGRIECRAPTD